MIQQDKLSALKGDPRSIVMKKETEEEISWTQPSDEVLENHQAEDNRAKTKKQPKKQQWGPVIPLRRRSRRADDGRTVMECA